MNVKVALFMVN